jgi:hypothetical protein
LSFRGYSQLESLASSPIQVKYLGGDNESLQFNVKYENKSAGSFRLLALNESGEIWFQENYRTSSRDFDKKLTIPRITETEYVIFLLRTANEPEISFKVKVTTKVVDDVVEASK